MVTHSAEANREEQELRVKEILAKIQKIREEVEANRNVPRQFSTVPRFPPPRNPALKR